MTYTHTHTKVSMTYTYIHDAVVANEFWFGDGDLYLMWSVLFSYAK